jgi:hypothetical protein
MCYLIWQAFHSHVPAAAPHGDKYSELGKRTLIMYQVVAFL